jgi:hypothetical protein
MIYGVLIFVILLLIYLLLTESKKSCSTLPVVRYQSNPDRNLSKLQVEIENEGDGRLKDIDIFDSRYSHIKSWKDKKSNLVWEVKNISNYETKYTYKDALKYVESLNRDHYDGFQTWRLPTIDELLTLGNVKLFDYRDPKSSFAERGIWIRQNAYKRSGTRFVKSPFSIIMNAQVESWYWSSTPYAKDNNSAWVVDFFEGGNFHNCKKDANLVMSVRNNTNRN